MPRADSAQLASFAVYAEESGGLLRRNGRDARVIRPGWYALASASADSGWEPGGWSRCDTLAIRRILSDIFSSDKIPQPLGARLRLLGTISRAVIYRPSLSDKGKPGILAAEHVVPHGTPSRRSGEDLSEG